jgi:ATP-dependent RNA helicase DeaD
VPPSRRAKAYRLFSEGGISPNWVALPTADEIRALDRDRQLKDETPFADLTDHDREMGAALLATRPAEELAAALARIFRARLPEPEEIDPLPIEDMRPPRKSKGVDSAAGPLQGRWFELSVGRHDKATPKGILRMLMRGGGVERRFIGGIRIHDQTTHVEISHEAAERFQKRNANPAPDEIRVRPLEEPGAKPKRHRPDKAAKGDFSKGDFTKGDGPKGDFSKPAKGFKRDKDFTRDDKPRAEAPHRKDGGHAHPAEARKRAKEGARKDFGGQELKNKEFKNKDFKGKDFKNKDFAGKKPHRGRKPE